ATFIASGNVIFSTNTVDRSCLEEMISRHLEHALGYHVDVFVRSAAEVVAIGNGNIFSNEAGNDTIHVGLLHRELPAQVSRKLGSIKSDVDAFHVAGREYYWLCRVKITESRIWMDPEVKALRLPS